MTEADFERLFWQEADGPPSAKRRQRFAALLRERPEMKSELARLEEFAALLDGVEEVEPPPELRAGVRRAIASRPAHGSESEGSLTAWLRPLLAARWQARLAYATLGVLIGAFGVQLFFAGPAAVSEADRSRLSGTLAAGGEEPHPTHEIYLGAAAGRLRLAGDGTELVADLVPAAGERLELVLEREDGRLAPQRVEGIRAVRHEIETAPGRLRLVADGPLTVVLDVGGVWPAAVTARVTNAAGAAVLERRLELTTPAGES